MNAFTRLAFFSCLGIAAQMSAVTLDLSEAGDYNLVTWGNADLISSSAGGRVAVGGNSLFKWYSIAGNSTVSDPSDAAYVVGGNLNAVKGGSVSNGNIYVGGNYNGPGYNLNTAPGSSVSSRLGKANLPFDFEAVQQALAAKSQAWGQAGPTGTSTHSYSTLTLEGSNADLNIFNIDGGALGSISTLNILIPDAAKALINVSGAIVNFSNMGISGNYDARNTLYNFHEATKLTMTGIGVEGSILAVNANVHFYSGNVNGQVIANSFKGKGWGVGSLGDYAFDNEDFHSPSFEEARAQVPDSGTTLVLAVFGISGLLLSRRYMRG